MKNMRLIYTEPEMELIELKHEDVITSSYGDYTGTGNDEEYDTISF